MGSQDQVGTMDTWKAAVFPPYSCLFVAFEFLELGMWGGFVICLFSEER